MITKDKLSNIKLLLLDVDGVLTDGTITYCDSGEQIKSFNSKDGLGLRLLMDSGVQVGIVTGRTSMALKHRCDNIGITLLFDGIKEKSKILSTIESRTKIPAEHMAYVGDDLIDLPIMKKVGLSFCVADASDEVKDHADIVTEKNGGKGAVREICEMILKSKGKWETILNRYLL
ncbi:MAG: HAD-IIIA family hydrolase [Proteobacteria bacterium]|nr:HAD-IIIA family hydrolase [Pseudomonadota bacterium]MBU1386980.1 HAD-IIIA family hydrolase [Pseudomonadota bacterium]MBU1542339.1 HAD-IIIA family hydrolase [Pseudomonadota bacterium]MBU2430851.1 HAD-IIIA family hydrolase [Pseudomonadota bacterium]MBU2481802.1 HAD-IIIA family hydrolase [Pseudomonadota bacterium]